MNYYRVDLTSHWVQYAVYIERLLIVLIRLFAVLALYCCINSLLTRSVSVGEFAKICNRELLYIHVDSRVQGGRKPFSKPSLYFCPFTCKGEPRPWPQRKSFKKYCLQQKNLSVQRKCKQFFIPFFLTHVCVSVTLRRPLNQPLLYQTFWISHFWTTRHSSRMNQLFFTSDFFSSNHLKTCREADRAIVCRRALQRYKCSSLEIIQRDFFFTWIDCLKLKVGLSAPPVVWYSLHTQDRLSSEHRENHQSRRKQSYYCVVPNENFMSPNNHILVWMFWSEMIQTSGDKGERVG